MSRTSRLVLVLVSVVALAAGACGDDGGDDEGAKEGPTISIGAQDFGESAILAQIYKQGLEHHGYRVRIQELGGFRDLELAAFRKGEINFAPEYAASMLEFLNDQVGEATADVDATVEALQGYLDDKELQALEPSEAVDTNSFAVTKETADEVGLASLSDLAAKGKDLKLGGPPDCETNPFCIPGLERVYELDLTGSFQALEPGAVAQALDAGAIDIGLIFSTDGRIAERDWVVLDDDKQMLAADNVVPVATDELLDEHGDDLVDAVNEISAKLTTEELTVLNKRFDVDKEDAEDIAREWLEEQGLV